MSICPIQTSGDLKVFKVPVPNDPLFVHRRNKTLYPIRVYYGSLLSFCQ